MSEVTVTLTLAEAEALCPAPPQMTVDEWNRRANAAEDAVQKIRTGLRDARKEQPKEQESML